MTSSVLYREQMRTRAGEENELIGISLPAGLLEALRVIETNALNLV